MCACVGVVSRKYLLMHSSILSMSDLRTRRASWQISCHPYIHVHVVCVHTLTQIIFWHLFQMGAPTLTSNHLIVLIIDLLSHFIITILITCRLWNVLAYSLPHPRPTPLNHYCLKRYFSLWELGLGKRVHLITPWVPPPHCLIFVIYQMIFWYLQLYLFPGDCCN